jgi:isopentenyldiphosphate isomerase
VPELLDILDDHGKPTGETMARAQVHQGEFRHAIALVWVYNSKGEILLQLRAAHLNAFPEKWDVTVSGHLMSGENPGQAAARELQEEVGIYMAPDEAELLGEITDSFDLTYGKRHNEYDYVFLTKQDELDLEKLRLQAAEVLEVRWITLEELESDLADPVKAKRYSGRNRQIFQMMIKAVRQRAQAATVTMQVENV